MALIVVPAKGFDKTVNLLPLIGNGFDFAVLYGINLIKGSVFGGSNLFHNHIGAAGEDFVPLLLAPHTQGCGGGKIRLGKKQAGKGNRLAG